ncbi:MAG: ABC transporter substrate-binding protein [Fretibacterium sp.]|nr:ABC transporter substrate-binding protein [Fretibacterium sp.]
MKKRVLALGLFCALLFGAAIEVHAGEIENFIVGMPADAKAIDPHQSVDNYSFAVLKHINQPLVTMDGKTKELVPILAEKWEILDDVTYKFYLKKGVKFHNGDELTAEDVVFSFKRMMTDPKSFYTKSRGKFIDPDGFEIIDKHTVIIRTRGPLPIWLSGMRHPYANILCKRAVEEAGEEYFRNPVGTGAYKFKNWVKGEKIELERFDDYHGKKANIKNLTFLIIPDASSRVIALETGKADLIYEVPGNDVERLNSLPNTKVVESEGLILHHLFLNTQKKPMDDPRVRKAIEYAVNKEAYGQVVYQGRFTVPVGPILPVSSFFPKDAKPYPYDPAKAKELLKEAGYPDGFEAELWIANFADRISGATVLQSMLAEVGIKVNVTVYETGVFDGLGKEPGYDMAIRTVGMQTARDAGDYWNSMLHSSSIGGYNWAQMNDPELDKLIVEANAEMDAAKRDVMLQAIWDKIDELHPDVALSIPSELYGARKDLVGLELLGDGRQNYLGDLTLEK